MDSRTVGQIVVYAAITGAFLLPLIFRSATRLRVLCVCVLCFAGLVTCNAVDQAARFATTARAKQGKWNEDYRDGVLDTQSNTRALYPMAILIFLGLAALAVVPAREKSDQTPNQSLQPTAGRSDV